MKRRDFLLAAVAAAGLLPERRYAYEFTVNAYVGKTQVLTRADIDSMLRGVYESYRVTVFPKLPFTVKSDGGWREQRFDAAPARYLRR